MAEKPNPIVLFDGVCNLCNRSVAHIIRHDPKGRFWMASLQSAVGRSLQVQYGLNPDAVDTIVLIEHGKAYTKSDAALRITRRLSGPSRYWYAARFVPKFLRDAAYNWVARNRYRWFGKREECMVPEPGLRERFLDADEQTSPAADDARGRATLNT